MENNEPNKIVKKLLKTYETLGKSYIVGAQNAKYWDNIEILKMDLKAITSVTGAIEVMSKKSILILISLQSKLRFMPEHRFYMFFCKALDKE